MGVVHSGAPPAVKRELQGFGDRLDRLDAHAKACDVLPMLAKAGVWDVSHVEFRDTAECRPAELRTDFRFAVIWRHEE